jgi:hypothetical protein
MITMWCVKVLCTHTSQDTWQIAKLVKRKIHLEALAQHSSGEVMGHELVVDEAHDAVSKEKPGKMVS